MGYQILKLLLQYGAITLIGVTVIAIVVAAIIYLIYRLIEFIDDIGRK